MKRLKKSSRFFLFLLPVLLLIGYGIFVLTTNKVKLAQGASCGSLSSSGDFNLEETVAVFEGEELKVPLAQLMKDPAQSVLGSTAGEKGERWIEVDLSEQKLKAYEGSSLFLESLVSTGLPWWPTPTGEFRIWTKFRATKMEGGSGKYYYYLPNVPYVMFFENSQVPGFRGYSLHGTYWHNDFGTRRSHGCVNLPTPIAEKLYFWTTPEPLDGKSSMRATSGNPGTRIVIHD